MSDLDALVAAFQTQLSDVMETVVRTAMYEVTRLVEDGLLREMRRRSQEVESLRIQLQWAESKLRAQEGTDGGRTRRRADCAKDDLELSCDPAEKGAMEKQDGKDKNRVVQVGKHFIILLKSFNSRCVGGLWCEGRGSLCGRVGKKGTGSHPRDTAGSRQSCSVSQS